MESDQDKSAADLVTIAGGIAVEVRYRDNHTNGQSERVIVRQIPISKLQEFLLTMGNESATIELYCDKPAGWADTLAVESANEIADKGQEINLPFLNAWWRRQARWRKMQLVSIGEVENASNATEPASPTSAPRSPTTTT